jgi:hypothetical protein
MFGWVVSLWKVRIFWTPLRAIEVIFRSYCFLISYLLTSNDIPKTYSRYFNMIYSISFMENGPSIDDFANNLMVFHSAVRNPFFQDIPACSKSLRVETNRTNQCSQKLMDSFPTRWGSLDFQQDILWDTDPHTDREKSKLSGSAGPGTLCQTREKISEYIEMPEKNVSGRVSDRIPDKLCNYVKIHGG